MVGDSKWDSVQEKSLILINPNSASRTIRTQIVLQETYIDISMDKRSDQQSSGHMGPSRIRYGISELAQDTPFVDFEIPGKISNSSVRF